MRHCRAFQKLVIAERVCMSKEITKTTMQVALSRPTVGLASKPTLSCHSKELAWLREEMMMPMWAEFGNGFQTIS